MVSAGLSRAWAVPICLGRLGTAARYRPTVVFRPHADCALSAKTRKDTECINDAVRLLHQIIAVTRPGESEGHGMTARQSPEMNDKALPPIMMPRLRFAFSPPIRLER